MDYAETPVKTNLKGVNKKMLIMASKQVGTWQLIRIIIMRHKVGLLITSNLILLISFVFPPWFDLAISIFTRS